MLPGSFSLCPSVLLTLLGAGGRTDESKIKREGVRPEKTSFEKETKIIKDPKNRESISSSSYNSSFDPLTIQAHSSNTFGRAFNAFFFAFVPT